MEGCIPSGGWQVGPQGPLDVNQPVLRDVPLRRIDMGHTDGRSLFCYDPRFSSSSQGGAERRQGKLSA